MHGPGPELALSRRVRQEDAETGVPSSQPANSSRVLSPATVCSLDTYTSSQRAAANTHQGLIKATHWAGRTAAWVSVQMKQVRPQPPPLLLRPPAPSHTLCVDPGHTSQLHPRPLLSQIATPDPPLEAQSVPLTGTVPQIQGRGQGGPGSHSGLFSQVSREWSRRWAQTWDGHVHLASWTPHPVKMGMVRGGPEWPPQWAGSRTRVLFAWGKGHMPQEPEGAGSFWSRSSPTPSPTAGGGKAWRSCSSQKPIALSTQTPPRHKCDGWTSSHPPHPPFCLLPSALGPHCPRCPHHGAVGGPSASCLYRRG